MHRKYYSQRKKRRSVVKNKVNKENKISSNQKSVKLDCMALVDISLKPKGQQILKHSTNESESINRNTTELQDGSSTICKVDSKQNTVRVEQNKENPDPDPSPENISQLFHSSLADAELNITGEKSVEEESEIVGQLSNRIEESKFNNFTFANPIIDENLQPSYCEKSKSSDIIECTPPSLTNRTKSTVSSGKDFTPVFSKPQSIESLQQNNIASETFEIVSGRSSVSTNATECSPPRLINPENFYVPESSSGGTTPTKNNEASNEETTSQIVLRASPSMLDNYENLQDWEQPSTSKDHQRSILQEDLFLSSDDSVADPDWKKGKGDLTETDEDDDDNEPTAKSKKRTRWSQRNDSLYHRNQQKVLRSKCLPYKDYKKRLQPPKAPKLLQECCKLNCLQKIKEEDRNKICKSYWGLADFKRQKDFILANVKALTPKRRLVAAKRPRTATRIYYFKIGSTKIKVCEKFFKATLCISNGPINKAFSGVGETGIYDLEDQRGKHEPPNKTSLEDKNFVRQHIESFPTMESHYCRQSSSKLYLEENLSVLKMYELYQERCQETGNTPVSQYVYRTIFATEYNMDFHKTKKDQCLTCHKYKTAKKENSDDLDLWQEKFNKHIALKIQSQTAKESDKKRANEDESFNSITLDLQKVLHMPNSNVSLLYYMRKINVYNATIYEARSPNDAYCFLWNELNGKKGSDEVGTAIYLWIRRIPETVKEISIFTDTCAGQNRNQFLLCMFLYLVQKSHLEIIEQKFLEPGHTHMEVDSMHSAIETQLNFLPVYSMHDYCNIIKLARSNRKVKKGAEKKKPYEPVIMNFSDILDLKDLNKTMNLKTRLVGSDGQRLEWLKIKCLRFEKQKPGIVLYRYDYESDYTELNLISSAENTETKKALRKRRSKAPAEKKICFEEYDLKMSYSAMLPITKAKKKDLMKMCTEKIIPTELHPWYQSLPEKEGTDYAPEDEDDFA